MTGFARIVRYHNVYAPVDQQDGVLNLTRDAKLNMFQNPANLSLIEVIEGEFVQGKKEGYCRTLSAEDGSCKVGFYV